MSFNDVGNWIDENICTIQCGGNVHGTILDSPRCDADCLTPGDLDSGSCPGGQVASPKNLHEAVRILSPSNGLQSRGGYLPPCSANRKFYLSQLVPLTQGRLYMEKRKLTLHPGDVNDLLCIIGGADNGEDIIRMDNDNHVSEMCLQSRVMAQQKGTLKLKTCYLLLLLQDGDAVQKRGSGVCINLQTTPKKLYEASWTRSRFVAPDCSV
jgi:hypothetical protein